MFPISGICSPKENEHTTVCWLSYFLWCFRLHIFVALSSWWKNPKRHIILISFYFPIPWLHIPLPGNSDKLFRQLHQWYKRFSNVIKKKRKMKSFRTNNNQGPYILFLPGLRIQELRASKLKVRLNIKWMTSAIVYRSESVENSIKGIAIEPKLWKLEYSNWCVVHRALFI